MERRYVATLAGDCRLGGGVASDWRQDPANTAAGRTVAASLFDCAGAACLPAAQLACLHRRGFDVGCGTKAVAT